MLRLRWFTNLSHYAIRSRDSRVRVCLTYLRSAGCRRAQRVSFSSSSHNNGAQLFLAKYKTPLIGAGVVLSGAATYLYLSRSRTEDVTKTILQDEIQDKLDDVEFKFVDEQLDEKLDLLQKFGPIPYVIVGAGAASYAAYRAIRASDPVSRILVLGEESHHPYMRPPLTKEMWFDDSEYVIHTLTFKQWSGKERSIFFDNEYFYRSVPDMLEAKNGGVSVLRGVKVVRIDPTNQILYLDNGKSISYEKCLLAPGSQPRTFPAIHNTSEDVQKHVMMFKNVDDFKRLHRTMDKVESVVIVGGGFLGSELACALGKRSQLKKSKVIQLFPESGNLGRVLPKYLSEWTSAQIASQGVRILPNVTIHEASKTGEKVKLCLSNGESITTDFVVLTVGSRPRTELAEVSGLELDEEIGGFVVNAELEARKNLWVAGDAASFYDVTLGRRRVEHHDNAIVSGKLAGQNMTGKKLPYLRQAMIWTDLGPELGFEAIGKVDSSLDTVGVFYDPSSDSTEKIESESVVELNEPLNKKLGTENEQKHLNGHNYDKGVVFYLQENKIVGIVLCNVFTKMSLARKIIEMGASYDDLAEVAKLFALHTD